MLSIVLEDADHEFDLEFAIKQCLSITFKQING
mgnify:CR=1 FL=1